MKSALYAIHPFPQDSEEPQFFVILYPDLSTGDVDYEITDGNHMQLRVMAQIPKSVLAFASRLYEQVIAWSEGRANYPHSQYRLPEPEDEPQFEHGRTDLDARSVSAVDLIEKAGGTYQPSKTE